MKFCQQCGKQLNDDDIFCFNCGYPQNLTDMSSDMPNDNSGYHYPDDSVNRLFVVLAFLVPLFGLIYSIAARKTHPKCAKYCGIAAMIAYVLTYLMLVSNGF